MGFGSEWFGQVGWVLRFEKFLQEGLGQIGLVHLRFGLVGFGSEWFGQVWIE